MLGSRTPIVLLTFAGAALLATPGEYLRAQAGAATGAATGAARDGAPLVVTGRSVVTTKLGIVATSQPLASAAGAQILAQGGNAIDAAIAANAVLGLTEPMMSGIGGDLFAIVYEAKTGKVYGLNASGWAASGVTAELVASKSANGRMPQRGVWSVTVPGAVAGWEALRTRFGTMSYEQLLAPAIHHAEQGFPVGEITARLWLAGERVENAAFKQAFLLNGKAPRSGEEISNPDMAKTLRRITRAQNMRPAQIALALTTANEKARHHQDRCRPGPSVPSFRGSACHHRPPRPLRPCSSPHRNILLAGG